MKQETLEEAAEKNLDKIIPHAHRAGFIQVAKPQTTMKETIEEVANKLFGSLKTGIGAERRAIWMNGAKFQQEQDKKMYSEEEVLRIITSCKEYLSFGDEFNEKQWFEQIKNK
jgi:hypothetical protein